jgi:hypothetical protein
MNRASAVAAALFFTPPQRIKRAKDDFARHACKPGARIFKER